MICYSSAMTRREVREILDRVLIWAPEEHESVAHFVEQLEEWQQNDEMSDRVREPEGKHCTRFLWHTENSWEIGAKRTL